MAKRTDIHRPSAIEPEDYVYVTCTYNTGDPLTDAEIAAEYREAFNAHREATGGKFSQHEHGGVCHICGAGCIYTAIFYHEKTNTYIKTGLDCAQKMEMGNAKVFRDFRDKARADVEARAGKNKAKKILGDAGLGKAWEIYEARDWSDPYEETTVADIVGKLVRYGNISDKQANYVGILLERIEKRPEIEAAKKAEHEAAAPCPKGRLEITGEVLCVKQQNGYYDKVVTKMLVKTDEGYKVWGTVPSSLDYVDRKEESGYEWQGIQKGDRVSLTATVEPSKDDEKFGFYKRPTKAKLLEVGKGGE